MAFNYNRALQVWAIPLLLVAFFAYLAAHSFLSVFETVLDTLFLCFAVDLETNDGSSEKPYFMDPGFLVSNILSPVVMSILLSLLLRAPSPSVEDSHTREIHPASFLVQRAPRAWLSEAGPLPYRNPLSGGEIKMGPVGSSAVA